MKRSVAWLVFCAGCAGSAGEARLAATVDPALQQSDVPKALAAYESLGIASNRRVRLLAETVVRNSLQALDPEERVRAAGVALAADDATLAGQLPARLHDADPRVRALAAVTLAPQSAEARAVLKDATRSDDARARCIALDGLSSLEDPAGVLERLSSDVDVAVRARVAGELGAARARVPGALAESLLRRLSVDGDAGVRASALRAVGTLGNRALAPEVDRGLADPSLGVRLAALAALGRLDGTPARLAALGQGADHFVALRAAVALIRFGRAGDALAVLKTAAADRRAEVRSAAMNAASELGEPGSQLALTLLRDPDLGVRLDAARVLVHGGHFPAALPVLVSALSSPFALDAAAELARLGDARGAPLLAAAARDRDPSVRRHALLLLGPLPGSLPSLIHALADPDAPVRLDAAATLLRTTRHHHPLG